MKNITKKIMIYSLAGIMQVGLGATVVAASPLYNDSPQKIVQLDDRHRHHRYRHDNDNVIVAGVVGFILGSTLN